VDIDISQRELLALIESYPETTNRAVGDRCYRILWDMVRRLEAKCPHPISAGNIVHVVKGYAHKAYYTERMEVIAVAHDSGGVEIAWVRDADGDLLAFRVSDLGHGERQHDNGV